MNRILIVAQDQHRCVVDAIVRRESGRAEAIMREHARLAHRNLERAFANQRIELVPGAAPLPPQVAQVTTPRNWRGRAVPKTASSKVSVRSSS